jgi:hypothetical protein
VANVIDETAYQVMPPLSKEEYAALKADIEIHGVLVPVEYDEDGNILDGHHRVQACKELGKTDWPRMVRSGLDDAGKRQHARRLNMARRHLNQEQRRDLIAAFLRDHPDWANNRVAAEFGVHNETVDTVRTVYGIRKPDHTVGKDGKSYPSKKLKADKSEPAAKKAKTEPTKPASAAADNDAETSAERRKAEYAAAEAEPDPAPAEAPTPVLVETPTVADKEMDEAKKSFRSCVIALSRQHRSLSFDKRIKLREAVGDSDLQSALSLLNLIAGIDVRSEGREAA